MLKPPPILYCAMCGNDSDALYQHSTEDWRRRNEQVRQLLHERDRQDGKWGEQNHSPGGRNSAAAQVRKGGRFAGRKETTNG